MTTVAKNESIVTWAMETYGAENVYPHPIDAQIAARSAERLSGRHHYYIEIGDDLAYAVTDRAPVWGRYFDADGIQH